MAEYEQGGRRETRSAYNRSHRAGDYRIGEVVALAGTGLPRKGGQYVNTVQVLQREAEKSKEGRQEAKDEGIRAVS